MSPGLGGMRCAARVELNKLDGVRASVRYVTEKAGVAAAAGCWSDGQLMGWGYGVGL